MAQGRVAAAILARRPSNDFTWLVCLRLPASGSTGLGRADRPRKSGSAFQQAHCCFVTPPRFGLAGDQHEGWKARRAGCCIVERNLARVEKLFGVGVGYVGLFGNVRTIFSAGHLRASAVVER